MKDETRQRLQSLQRSLEDFFNHADEIPEIGLMADRVAKILQEKFDNGIQIRQIEGMWDIPQKGGASWVRTKNLSNEGFSIGVKTPLSEGPITLRIEGAQNKETVEQLHKGVAWYRKRILQTIRSTQKSYKDPLTGLFNKLYRDTFSQALEPRVKSGEIQVGVISIDIEDFKKINEAYGHAAGDEVLQKFGAIFKSLFIGQYTIKIVRNGGDEFMVLSIFDGSLDRAYITNALQDTLNIIKSSLSEINAQGGIPFQGQQQGENRAVINMHTGFAVWDTAESFRGVLDRADPKLNKKTA